MDAYLNTGELSREQIVQGLRLQTLSNEIVLVTCGTAFKNKGVQAMLDAVIDFMPSPLDVPAIKGILNDKDETESSMINYLNLQKEKQNSLIDENKKIIIDDFINESLNVNVKDYYFSNVIARSSKTMIECNNSKLNLKSTGTEG